MENVSVKDIVLEKKLDSYGGNTKDFKASQELTVEITLSEYRELVGNNATRKSDIDRANSDKYERENEIKNLKAKLEELKAENYELKKAVEERSKCVEKECVE